jgi:hypothetical protein
MSRASNLLVLVGFAFVALFYILAIYEGPLGNGGDYYFHGIVILIGALGFILASVGAAIGAASTVRKATSVLGIILSTLLLVSISIALFVYPS